VYVLTFAAAILIIYLTGQLRFSDSRATAIYHMFVFVAYFSPLFGAILADGHIGKYRYFASAHCAMKTTSTWLEYKCGL